jgi:hypothetical protein
MPIHRYNRSKERRISHTISSSTAPSGLRLPLNIKYIFCFDITEPMMTSQTNYIKRTIVIQFAIGLLLLFFLINYNVFAQTRELSEEEQPEDITDFADLTTSTGPAPISGSATDQASSNGTDEVNLTPEDGERNPTAMTDEYGSLQTHLDAARDALVNRDNIKSMEEINSIDMILFNVSRGLEDED